MGDKIRVPGSKKWELEPIPCKHCSKEFYRKRKNTKFCSRKCYANNRNMNLRPPKSCKTCGKQFKHRKGSGSSYNFCSEECKPKGKADIPPRKCPMCDNMVIQNPKVKGKIRVYCSISCGKKASYKPDRAKRWADEYRASPEGRAKVMFGHAKTRAKRKKIEFTLELEKIITAVENGHCEATGIRFVLDLPETPGKHHPYAPSIERIDSSIGYTNENCQVVTYAFNSMKNQWDMDIIRYVFTQFFQFREDIYGDDYEVFLHEDPLLTNSD